MRKPVFCKIDPGLVICLTVDNTVGTWEVPCPIKPVVHLAQHPASCRSQPVTLECQHIGHRVHGLLLMPLLTIGLLQQLGYWNKERLHVTLKLKTCSMFTQKEDQGFFFQVCCPEKGGSRLLFAYKLQLHTVILFIIFYGDHLTLRFIIQTQ